MRILTNFLVALYLFVLVSACNAPSVENVYRKEGRFPGGLNVPVAFLVSEWAGKPRILASGWLIDGGNGTLFSAKHFTDVFMNNTIELGANECKIFLAGKVYTAIVAQVPPLRDAVVLKIIGQFNQSELPKPYKIPTTRVRVGDKVFVQGFHPHPSEVINSNMLDGLNDLIVPILKNFYELREADPSRQREVVFDNIEATVVDINFHAAVENQQTDPLGKFKFKYNEFIKVVTTRNHKFSFGGLSGGVVVKINEKGEPEAIGIVTAESPARYEHMKIPGGMLVRQVVDTMDITPIYSVKDLYDYARQMK